LTLNGHIGAFLKMRHVFVAMQHYNFATVAKLKGHL
jgi:hypothetical protein